MTTREKINNLKLGDTVTRMLAGTLSMPVVIQTIEEDIIICGSPDGFITGREGWTFNKDTGAEVDKDLGWDGITKTGSYLKL